MAVVDGQQVKQATGIEGRHDRRQERAPVTDVTEDTIPGTLCSRDGTQAARHRFLGPRASHAGTSMTTVDGQNVPAAAAQASPPVSLASESEERTRPESDCGTSLVLPLLLLLAHLLFSLRRSSTSSSPATDSRSLT